MTDKNLFREIHDDDDVSDIVKKCIVALVVGSAVIILLVAGWSMMQSTIVRDAETVQLEEELRQLEADPVWQAEERRLRKKHSDPVIIYEPGQVPYYYCGPGKKNKCKFM